MLASPGFTAPERLRAVREEIASPGRRTSRHMTPDRIVRERLPAILPRMRRLARVLAGDPADADDLVQIALERALARAVQWRPEEPLDTWVFAILRNAWRDELRARARWLRVVADDPEAVETIAAAGAENPLDALAVSEAVARLPPEQREVVALVMVEGLAYREAAELLDVPIGTVTSRLARARDALQARLGET